MSLAVQFFIAACIRDNDVESFRKSGKHLFDSDPDKQLYDFIANHLVLLCHKFLRDVMRWQQGQRGRVCTNA